MEAKAILLLSLCTVALAQKECKDSSGSCRSLARYCNNAIMGSCVRKSCPLSCRVCKPVTTAAPATTPSTGCVDKKSQRTCNYYKGKNYCKEKFVSWMRTNCAQTCGFCGAGGKTTQPPVTTVGPTLPPGQCGTSQVQSGRVIAGTNAKQGYWPWQILMFYRGRTSCGGSLVAPNWVVTAAHCVFGRERQTYNFKVRVGEHDSRSPEKDKEEDIPVSKIISHPSYSRSTIDSDIALMKLSRPAKLGKYVNTVCLPGQGQHVPVGTQCFITGWGKIQHPGSMHHTLQQAKMPVVSKQACTNLNTRNLRIKITDNMVCAGHGGSTRVSGCHGDSGGPFVCQTGSNGRWELHGAVSWGSGTCSAKSSYTVFARVAQFRSWIDSTMTRN